MPLTMKTPNIKRVSIERAMCNCIDGQPELVYMGAFIIEGEQRYSHKCPKCESQWFLNHIYPRTMRQSIVSGFHRSDEKRVPFSQKG